jgi:hypothetical protein
MLMIRQFTCDFDSVDGTNQARRGLLCCSWREPRWDATIGRSSTDNFLILTTNPLYWTRMLCGQLVSEFSQCQVATFQVDFQRQNNLHSSLSIVAIGGTSAIFLKICVCVEK